MMMKMIVMMINGGSGNEDVEVLLESVKSNLESNLAMLWNTK